MPRGPNGEKRPADTVQAAFKVFQIAVGDDKDEPSAQPRRRNGPRAGGKARAEKLTDEERTAIAKKAAAARWR